MACDDGKDYFDPKMNLSGRKAFNLLRKDLREKHHPLPKISRTIQDGHTNLKHMVAKSVVESDRLRVTFFHCNLYNRNGLDKEISHYYLFYVPRGHVLGVAFSRSLCLSVYVARQQPSLVAGDESK